MIIRQMEFNDIKKVCKIERACFSDPWSPFSFENELANNHATYAVVAVGEEILGYGGMHVILDEGHITNMAVCPQFRRQNVADALLGWLCNFAGQKGVLALTLEVRASNVAALKLYEKHNFKAEGIRKEYYRNPKEDAVIMWKTLKVEVAK